MKALVKGSLLEKQEKDKKSMTEVLADVTAVLVFDCSGSMTLADNHDVSRHKRAQKEAEALQAQYPGRIAIICFNDSVELRFDGRITEPEGGTNYIPALSALHELDDLGMTFFFVSDGQPNEQEQQIYQHLASHKFKTKINTIYIGPETGDGRRILEEISRLTGGKHFKFGVDFENLISGSVSKILMLEGK